MILVGTKWIDWRCQLYTSPPAPQKLLFHNSALEEEICNAIDNMYDVYSQHTFVIIQDTKL